MRKPTAVAVAKRRHETAANHEDAAKDDGGLPAKIVGNVWRDEEGHDGANVEHVDEDGEFAVEDRILEARVVLELREEEPVPGVDLLRRVDQHAVVAGGCRGYNEDHG